MGRASKYNTHVKPHLKEISRLVAAGYTEESTAKRYGVSTASWENYKNKFPELIEAIKVGKVDIAALAFNGLVERARGVTVKNVRTWVTKDQDGRVFKKQEIDEKTYPPDVAACHILLKNLRRGEWSDHPIDDDLKQARLELSQKIAEEGGSKLLAEFEDFV